MMLENAEIVVLVFCAAAVLAAPTWLVVRFVRPPKRAR
jgi:hypothetical protein